MELVGAPGSGQRVREVAELLTALRDQRDADPEDVLYTAPPWLLDAFAPERTTEQAEAWLAQWRAAPDKVAFERDSGWSVSNWVHWFSADNEDWRLGDVVVDEDDRRLVVHLEHDDDPIAYEALRWLAIKGGLAIAGEARVA
ncbi:hypothetical protein GCM10020358_36720 [Amorphoplanes nipponensis]